MAKYSLRTLCVALILIIGAFDIAQPAIHSLSLGDSHTCASLSDGIKCWGDGAEGQTGRGSNAPYGLVPGDMAQLMPLTMSTTLTQLHHVVQVSAGGAHTLVLWSVGKVTAFGYGGDGALGMGSTANVADSSPLSQSVEYVPINSLYPLSQVSAGLRHSCALSYDGKVWCWGSGTYRKLGNNAVANIGDDAGEVAALNPISFAERAVQVEAGVEHTCIVLDGGSLKCFGHGANGRLGYDSTADTPGLATAVSDVSIPAVVQVAASRHTCVLTAARGVRCWGRNDQGQCGTGDSTDRGTAGNPMATVTDISFPPSAGDPIRVTVGYAHTCVWFTSDQVLCFGDNTYHQLGHTNVGPIGDNGGEMTTLVPAGVGSNIVDLAAGYRHTCTAHQTTGPIALRCFGDASYGQLGGDSSNNTAAYGSDVPLGTSSLGSVYRMTPTVLQAGGWATVRLYGPFSQHQFFESAGILGTVSIEFRDTASATVVTSPCLPFASSTEVECPTPVFPLATDASATVDVYIRVNASHALPLNIQATLQDASNTTQSSISPRGAPLVPGSNIRLKTTFPMSPMDLRWCHYNDIVENGESTVPASLIDMYTIECSSLPAATTPHSMSINITYGAGFPAVDGVVFTYYNNPSVDSISPSLGPVAGLTEVRVVGSGFTDAGQGFVLRFESPNATWTDVPAYPNGTNALRATTIDMGAMTLGKFDLPAQLVVKVSLNGGADFGPLTSGNFTLYPNPLLTSIAPISLPVTSNNPWITLSGKGFFDSPVIQVKFSFTGALAGYIILANATHDFDTGNVLVTFPVTQPTGGIAIVEVGFNGQQFTNSRTPFSLVDLQSLTPVAGPSSGGTKVTLSGLGFLDTAQLQCRFTNTTHQVAAKYISATTVTCVTPDIQSGVTVTSDVQVTFDDTNYSNGTVSFVHYVPSTVYGIAPLVGPSSANTTITLNGTNFVNTVQAACRVGEQVIAAKVLSSTLMECVLQPATGVFPIEFTFNLVDYFTTAYSFNYYSPYGLEPSAGPSAGNNEIIIFGQGFEPSVKYCRFGTATVLVTSVSSIQVRCNAPQLPPGGVQVDISTNNSTYTDSGRNYTYYATPQVTNVSPRAGLASGGDTVTVSGLNFDFASAVPKCRFGDLVVSAVTLSGGSSFLCVTPAGFGKVTVQVSLNAGSIWTTGTQSYTYSETLSISPESGTASGGTTITVTGSGYIADTAPTMQCRIGTALVPATRVSDSRVLCVSPKAVPGVVRVLVTPTGSLPTSGITGPSFSYFANPALIDFRPISGRSLGSTPVTVIGADFSNTGGVNCRFGAEPAQTVSFLSSTAIICQSPPGSGQSTLSVTFNKVDYTNMPTQFTYYSMISMQPKTGPRSGQTVLDIVGTGFTNELANELKCKILSFELSANYIRSDLIRCVTPPIDEATPTVTALLQAASSSVEVFISTNNGVDYEGANPRAMFEYYHPPKVTGISPSAGISFGGVEVTVTGSGFRNNGLLSCRFGDDLESIPIQATFVSTTMLTCQSSAHNGGTVEPFVSMNLQQFHAAEKGVNFTYTLCPPGSFAVSHRVPCQLCPPGEFSNRYGARACTKCDLTSYADNVNQTKCTPCPANSAINVLERDNITLCECKKGFYTPTNTTGTACLDCPPGGVCAGGLEAPIPDANWWKSSLANETFIECPNDEQCVGGMIGCAPGYSGRLCSECVDGYYASGSYCKKCPVSNFVTLPAFVLFVLLTAGLMIFLVGKRASCYTSTLHLCVQYFQVLNLIMNLEYGWPVQVREAFLWVAVPFNWNLDVLGGECYLSLWTFEVKVFVMLCLPLVYSSMIIMIYLFCRCFGWKRGYADWDTLWNVHLDAVCLCISLSYFVMILTSLRVFDCTPAPDGVEELDYLPSLECFQEWWWHIAPVAAMFLIFYGVGYPLLLGIVLKRNRKAVIHPEFLHRYGSVMVPYRRDSRYWEVIFCVEKGTFGLIALYFTIYPTFQVLSLLVVTIAGLALTSIFRPFFFKRYTLLSVIFQWNIAILLLMGMVFRVGDFRVPGVRPFAIAVCFTVLFIGLLALFWILIYDVVHIHRALKRNPKGATISKANRIFHPAGRTLFMEWLAQRPQDLSELDLIKPDEVHDIVHDIVTYTEQIAVEPGKGREWSFADQAMSTYCSHLLYASVIPDLRRWFTNVVHTIKDTRDPKLMRTVYLFYQLFGELAKFEQYRETAPTQKSISDLDDIELDELDRETEFDSDGEPVQLGLMGNAYKLENMGLDKDLTGSSESELGFEVEELDPNSIAAQALDPGLNGSSQGDLASKLMRGWNDIMSGRMPWAKKAKLGDLKDSLDDVNVEDDLAEHMDNMDTAHLMDASVAPPMSKDVAEKFMKAQLIPVDLNSEQALAIARLMATTSVSHAGRAPESFELVSVDAIANPRLLRRYKEARNDVQAALLTDGYTPDLDINENLELATEVNEYYLWHGLNGNVLDAVVETGFQPGLSNLEGMFGAGVYFAEHFSKSHQYVHTRECQISGAVYGKRAGPRPKCSCRPPQDDTVYEILLCRVVLGDPFFAKSLMKRVRVAPLKGDSKTRRHDSIFAQATRANPMIKYNLAYNEFVVFDKDQAFPAFVVRYKNKG